MGCIRTVIEEAREVGDDAVLPFGEGREVEVAGGGEGAPGLAVLDEELTSGAEVKVGGGVEDVEVDVVGEDVADAVHDGLGSGIAGFGDRGGDGVVRGFGHVEKALCDVYDRMYVIDRVLEAAVHILHRPVDAMALGPLARKWGRTLAVSRFNVLPPPYSPVFSLFSS